MQVQVNGNPDEIVSITDFDFSQIFEDLEDEKIEDLVVLTLFMNYFESMSINHSNLPKTDINPNFTPMMFGLVKDYSNMEGHSEDSASIVCFNKRMVKELFALEFQLGEEALELPFEEFIELARPHLPPNLTVIQSPVTLRVVRATLPPPLSPTIPSTSRSFAPTNYIDVFDIVKEKLSNREAIVEGSHTVARYYPDGDYIEFVSEVGLMWGSGSSGGDCTPSFIPFRDNSLDNADGTMTARYRINGGSWQDYSAIPYVGAYSLAKDFLSELHWNGRRLFTDSGGGDAAFLFDYRDTGFSGAYERLEDNTNMVMEIVDPSAKITIDFQVTSRDKYDIVWMLFGQDITVHSCAIVRFAGI